MLAAGLLLWVFPGLPRWIGAAVVLACLPEFSDSLARAANRLRLRTLGPALFVLAVFVVVLWPLVTGDPPATRDHGIHYFQTRIFVDEFLREGRLSGWSNRFNHGYPFGESYPTLGYLLTSALHLVSGGAIHLRASYAWGILFVWLLGTLSAWMLARTVVLEWTRSTFAARVAGCVAGLAWLLDPGASRQGGWSYAMFHGVWPQSLSTALWALSLPLSARAIRDPSPRRVAGAGLLLGASIVAHPFGLLTAATSAAVWFVMLLGGATFAPDDDPRPDADRWLTWGTIHALAAALSAATVVTFLASADAMARSPVPWEPLGDLGWSVFSGDLVASHWAPVSALAVVGVIAILLRGRRFGWVVTGLLAALLLLGSYAAISTLRLDLLVGGFKNLQFIRYAIALKPVLFGLAGAGAVVVGHGLTRLPARAPASLARRSVVALVFAPLLVAMVERVDTLIERPIGALDTLRTTGTERAEARLRGALEHEREQLRDGRPFRVAFLRRQMGGGTYPIFSITDAGGDLVMDSHVPAVNFQYRVSSRSLAGFEALGVSHVVWDHPLPDQERALDEALVKLGRFGPYHLARLPAGEGRRPRVLEGTARLALVETSPETVRIEVTDATGPVTIGLPWAPHLRWQARFEGREIPVEIASDIRGLETGRVTMPAAGVLEVSYSRSPLETLTRWVSGVALVLSLLLLARRRTIESSWEVGERTGRFVRGSAAVIALGMVVFIAWRWETRLATTWEDAAKELEPDRSSPRFVRDLVLDRGYQLELDPPRMCDGLLGKSPLPGCREADLDPVGSMLYRDPYLYRCAQITVPPKGRGTFRLDPPEGSVVGFVSPVDLGHRGRKLRWHAGTGHPVPLGPYRRSFTLEPQNGAPAVLSFENRSDEPATVCIAAAAVRW